jgi:hypothetical protein
LLTQGCRCAPTAGLKLANAFGVNTNQHNVNANQQLLNYLRATDIEVGLLLNFGERPEFKRIVFDNLKKKTRNP